MNINKLILEDQYIDPNFNDSDLREIISTPDPIYFDNTYLVSDYNLIKTVLKTKIFTSHEIGKGNYEKLITILPLAELELKGDVLFSDNQQHVELRKILAKSYMNISKHIDSITNKIINEHFKKILYSKKICVSNEISTPISEKIFLEISGLAKSNEYEKYIPLFKAIRLIMNGIDNNLDKCDNGKDLIDSWEYVFNIVTSKVKQADLSYPNLISQIYSIESISTEIKAIMVIAFIRAGIENPRSFITSSIMRYFQFSNLYNDNIVGFLDETMRYDTPAKITARYVSDDICLNGIKFKKGRKIWLSFRLANFSPKIFDSPLSFKLREPNSNLSLGFGAHFCIGKDLTYKISKATIKCIIDQKYSLPKFDIKNYRLEDSVVFRRFTDPIYITKD